jgi:hypothetical protein
VKRLLVALAVAGCAHGSQVQRVDIAEPAVIESDPVQAQFAAAREEYEESRYEDAARRLHALAQRPGLAPLVRGSALLQEGVCRIEAGQRAEGQELLRQSLRIFDAEAERAAIDPTLRAQAEYWLGEAYDREFRDLPVDPSAAGSGELEATLQRKSELLLSAQGHFLRCIRAADGDWAVAAGYRIGEMYEQLHDQLVGAPVPKGLSGEQQALYEQELRAQLRILVQKALRVYEDTLSAAQRTGTRGDAVARAEAGLQRLRAALAESN